ncbi:acetyl/propionyl-CoA carboxylase subunit alpha [Fulvitalea axinellae]|uniref:Acetyl/propionyl-CoA carboxylase subunit alpha n=1 Tax=Fulvitalea axinellae TaxID=1182444 RepID=A0AAU9D7M6_9BACT|nr:acetyl/propionyl-CoA carboxylase subunit alpha [Fulvitalea axinellae]
MIKKILIANRGEIASRIIRTCRRLGIATVAVYSDADACSPFVEEADEAVALRGLSPAETYLDTGKILEAAKSTGADAVHPGYGFLSENAGFATACGKEGLIFIGPEPDVIEGMGDKKKAKLLAKKGGVPVVPGYEGEDQSLERFVEESVKIGFPVLLKATAGGGGKGMRIVRKPEDLESAFDSAKREALAAFANDTLILEKYFDSSRHIEVQVFGDTHGNRVHLFERECSIQRRYQKVVEESPSPMFDDRPELREGICSAALAMAETLSYTNAGTVEFIVDDAGGFYFLEVNTRLQVEHPVTEFVTGTDLVEWQIKVAEGEKLPLEQKDIQQKGHALELRLYAEDPTSGYLPQSGLLEVFEPFVGENVRWDTGFRSGSEISVYYDPMLAKMTTYGADRESAIRKALKALASTALFGPPTNKDFLGRVIDHPDFRSGDLHTKFLDERPELAKGTEPSSDRLEISACVATLFFWKKRNSKRTKFVSVPAGWRNNSYSPKTELFRFAERDLDVNYDLAGEIFEMRIGESGFKIELIGSKDGELTLAVDGFRRTFRLHSGVKEDVFVAWPDGETVRLHCRHRLPLPDEDSASKGEYFSPMPGEVVKVLVKSGDKVKSGDGLLILSSMKMENTISAHGDGVVEEVFVKENTLVEGEKLLLKMEEE